jgi:hypothetical protein
MDENKELPRVDADKNSTPVSPLAAYYRQPKIYINLPSKGEFYPVGALDKSQDGKYAVYSMTAKDELMLKTPDALMSGQSTVAVINSCVPSITDPWQMPTIDLDAILVGIRIASYGEKMDIDTNCPACKEDLRFEFNITKYLEDLARFEYIKSFPVGDLVVHIRPYTYREFTKKSIVTLEQQKIYDIVNDENMSDEEKIDRFGVSFVKLTQLTVEAIADVVVRIDTPTGSETNPAAIKDFIVNASKDTFEAINDKLQIMKASLDLKVKNATCDKCKHTFDVSITMDQANFFAARS